MIYTSGLYGTTIHGDLIGPSLEEQTEQVLLILNQFLVA